MSLQDRPASVQAEYERIGRERMEASRATERLYRWELFRVCAEMIGWTVLGSVIAAFGFHVRGEVMGWILFRAGMIVNWSGVLWALASAYLRGQKRGDW
jgi:hypothetical protein